MTAFDLMVLISISEEVEIDANEEMLSRAISFLANESLITGLQGDYATTAVGEDIINAAVAAADEANTP